MHSVGDQLVLMAFEGVVEQVVDTLVMGVVVIDMPPPCLDINEAVVEGGPG